ncbi:MAG: hypothetical protein KBI10_08035 [Syntrophorhabdales bacterium]|nr:hypothetical protein [Syntrophorhabdales bacterium]
MKEIFDINLLSQIRGLDKKLPISKEQLQLKRQANEEQKHKHNKQNPKKPTKEPQDKQDTSIKKQEIDGHISIDITA